MRRIYDTTCDIFGGPGSSHPGLLIGTFPCRLVQQGPISTDGLGSPGFPYWLTISDYLPIGAWTTNGFGMDARLSDQVAVPSGSYKRFWVVYSDLVRWYARTPYYRGYLSYLPLPSPYIPRVSAIVTQEWPPLLDGRVELLLPKTEVSIYLAGYRRAFRKCIEAVNSPVLASGIVLPKTTAVPYILTSFGVELPKVGLNTYQAFNPKTGLTLTVTATTPVGLSVRQRATASGSTSVTLTLPSPTVAGNSLLIGLAYGNNNSSATTPSISLPTGFSLNNETWLVGGAGSAILVYPSAPSQSGPITITLTYTGGTPIAFTTAWFVEIQGLASGTVDHQQDHSQMGPGATSMTSGTLPTSSSAVEYILAVFGTFSPGFAANTLSAPSTGFSLVSQVADTWSTPFTQGFSGGYCEQITTTTGTYACGLTAANLSTSYGACIISLH